jgi:hypothetical protein
MNLKTNKMESRDNLHNIALLFMQQFDGFELMSLDEFLLEYRSVLTPAQFYLGDAILKQFEYED